MGDWVVVAMPLDGNKGSRNFIAQVTYVKNGRFYGDFLRSVSTREHKGYVFAHPIIKDVAPFNFAQIRRKLRKPVTYLRSMCLFPINQLAVNAM